jgi:hypothetical protein
LRPTSTFCKLPLPRRIRATSSYVTRSFTLEQPGQNP